ncbi:uncharacterized protein LOC124203530 [Daphnia pulex]|uniref:uncharacterized protein LOC124203530 n=1 Tax=Daphnia pulex TaxID=6669 RepID=UPI001EDCF6AC|nr:uncharacterized protein LOC124203530 [Daphnia pulex]XP_046654123.1 uncharacterized protein LOC124344577 [Daphnia pulicaria]
MTIVISLLVCFGIAAGINGASVFTDRPPAGKMHTETNWHRVPESPQSSDDYWANLRSSPRILSSADRFHPSSIDRISPPNLDRIPPLTIDQIHPLNIDRMMPGSNLDRKLSTDIAHSSHSCQKILIVECL